jgi:hypothetical protein
LILLCYSTISAFLKRCDGLMRFKNRMAWKKLYKSDIWDFQISESLEGEYLNFKEGLGSASSKLYIVRTDDGKEVGFWGGAALDSQMKEVKVGTKIKVTYLGLAMSKKSHREYKNFEVEVWGE